jgi:hypothetical protein
MVVNELRLIVGGSKVKLTLTDRLGPTDRCSHHTPSPPSTNCGLFSTVITSLFTMAQDPRVLLQKVSSP